MAATPSTHMITDLQTVISELTTANVADWNASETIDIKGVLSAAIDSLNQVKRDLAVISQHNNGSAIAMLMQGVVMLLG